MSDDAAHYQGQLENDFEEEQFELEQNEEEDRHRSYYPSNVPDQYIVNAVTGDPYPYRVGSYDSLRLFHVTDATGYCDSQGISGGYNPEPNHLYYSDPREYMRHRGRRTPLTTSFIESWRSNVNRLFPTKDSEIDLTVMKSMRNAYNEKVYQQQKEAMEREEEQRMKRVDEKLNKERIEKERLVWFEATYDENRRRTNIQRKTEVAEAKKRRSKNKHYRARDNRRKAIVAAAEKVAKALSKATRKSERRRAAYAKMQARRNPAC